MHPYGTVPPVACIGWYLLLWGISPLCLIQTEPSSLEAVLDARWTAVLDTAIAAVLLAARYYLQATFWGMKYFHTAVRLG